MQRQPINNLNITGSNTSYTGNGASRPESFVGQEVEQGLYPQEAATRVTPAITVSLTTPQSGGQVPRIGHGSSTEQSQKLPASPMDQADADTMQLIERTAQTAHSARKREGALRQRSNVATDPDTWRVHRRRQRYRHRRRRTRNAQSSTNHIGQS